MQLHNVNDNNGLEKGVCGRASPPPSPDMVRRGDNWDYDDDSDNDGVIIVVMLVVVATIVIVMMM